MTPEQVNHGDHGSVSQLFAFLDAPSEAFAFIFLSIQVATYPGLWRQKHHLVNGSHQYLYYA